MSSSMRRSQEDSFVCERKEHMSCRDARDLEYDSTRTWVIDKLALPRTPKGFKRSLLLRKDYSKIHAYFITPYWKETDDSQAFIDANQDSGIYKNAPLGDFKFTVPKVMDDTVSCGISERTSKKTRNDFD